MSKSKRIPHKPNKSMFVGRWRVDGSELLLYDDGTWRLYVAGNRPAMFKLLSENNGTWLWAYSRVHAAYFPHGKLAFATSGGGKGFFVQVLNIDEEQLRVANFEGGSIALQRMPLEPERGRSARG